jgi:TRAP-type C4-dicarboxylate transport system permease small subunit
LSAEPTNGGGTTPRPGGFVARLVRALALAIKLWAMLGGIATMALALMTAASAVSNLLFDRPFAADHELTKHVIAVVIFTFLPYCQLAGANVTVDIFTERLGERPKVVLGLIASVLAIAFAILLLRQMSLGLFSYMRFVEVTPVLQLPLWTAFPPILFSLVLLLAAALVTFGEGLRRLTGRPPWLGRREVLIEEGA